MSDRHDAQRVGLTAMGGRADGARMPFPEPGIGPHYAPSRSVAIEHLELSLSIDPEQRRFSGVARVRVHALPTYAGRLAFDLDDVDVIAVEDGDGNALPFTCEEGQVRIRAASAPGTVVIRWEGADPVRGMYFTGPTTWAPERQHMAWTQCQDEDAHFLLPCHDHPGVKHPWTITLDAPSGYTLLSNGKRVDGGERDGRAWARYEQVEPMASYLFTAVAARLTAIDAKWRDRPVRYLVPEGQEEAVLRSMGKTPVMMETFSKLVGVDFPWPRYDQVVVHDFIFGGMENVACTTMTELLLVSEDAILEWDPDGLVAHELAHQWFGDLVTCQDWSQGWLNESWATFMEAAWWEADRAEDEAIWYRHDTARDYFEEHRSRYRRPIVSYRFREPIDVFDRHLYNKGSCVLWTLRNELGHDAFWAGVKLYLNRHAHQTVHTRHFQRALEEATGRNLDGFFDQWVHSAGHPELAVKLAPEGDLLTVSVAQKQSGDDVPEAFSVVLRLVVVLQDGTERTVDLPVRERERTWAVPVDGPIATVRVDPGFRMLAEIKLQAPEAWLERLLSDSCPVLAVRAASALLDSDGARAVRAAGKALQEHPFHGVRASIAGALGRRGGAAALDALIAALPDESDPRVRGAILQALGRMRDARAVDAVLADADRGFDTVQLKGSYLEALGRSRDPRARERLEAALSPGGWAHLVARKALAGLGATEDAAVADLLLAHTGTQHHDRVRAAAALAAGELADRHPTLRPRVVERLVEMLSEVGFNAQIHAIAALGRLREPQALGALGQVHATAPDGRMRRTAYEAMVRIREGRDSEQGFQRLRERLEELEEQNRKLRDRLEKLERH